eukprot:5642240-Amphidinium_carterae.2
MSETCRCEGATRLAGHSCGPLKSVVQHRIGHRLHRTPSHASGIPQMCCLPERQLFVQSQNRATLGLVFQRLIVKGLPCQQLLPSKARIVIKVFICLLFPLSGRQ